MKQIKITQLDEVNIHISGLPYRVYKEIDDELSEYVKGYHETISYQMGNWDGKRHFIESNFTFVYWIDTILEIINKYNLSDNVEFIDAREYEQIPDVDVEHIDETYLKDYLGFDLRDKQVDGIREAIINRKGILEYATNTGKSLVSAGICKAVRDVMRVVVVVPNTSLAKSTFKDIESIGEDCVVIDGKVPPNKRKEKIDNHRHVVITYKLFSKHANFFSDSNWFVIVDEVHIFGDLIFEALRHEVPHIQYRIGMTGTFPTKKENPEKNSMILSTIGGDVIDNVTNHELIQSGHSSKPVIYTVGTYHKNFMDEIASSHVYDWSVEQDYLRKNRDRINAIHEFIMNLSPKNTLILGDAQIIEKLAKKGNEDFVHQYIHTEQREESFNRFEENKASGNGYRLWASYGTSSVGISQNHIYRLILLDVGRSRSRILQSIGRGIRLDGLHNKVDVIDLYSMTPFSKKQFKDRMKLYKEQKFDTIELNKIEIRED